MTGQFKNIAWRAAAVAPLAGVFVWAYWPTLTALVSTWNRVSDYSHGFLVVPLAILILWVRREQFPGMSERLEWAGLVLVALSIAIRFFGDRYYLDAADGWSILVWVGGAVWFLCGWRVFRWSLPSVVFLWFMVPLPFRMEHTLSRPLQVVATRASCWILQCLGQPAMAENNVILLGDLRMEVEQACSGLRIFMGIIALAFVYVILVRRTWWEKVLLLASIVPVALVANVTRIVLTSLLIQWTPATETHEMIHQYIGYLMIPYAAGLFALVLWYIGKLVQTVDVADVGDLARHQRAEV
jgi:exosortase